MIVMLDYNENDAKELIKSINCELESINCGKNENEICSVAFGMFAGKTKDGIPELVSQADKQMYINKKEMKGKINRK